MPGSWWWVFWLRRASWERGWISVTCGASADSISREVWIGEEARALMDETHGTILYEDVRKARQELGSSDRSRLWRSPWK